MRILLTLFGVVGGVASWWSLVTRSSRSLDLCFSFATHAKLPRGAVHRFDFDFELIQRHVRIGMGKIIEFIPSFIHSRTWM